MNRSGSRLLSGCAGHLSLTVILLVSSRGVAATGKTDSMPPGGITDLVVETVEEAPFPDSVPFVAARVSLRWTAPGDDDHAGAAYRYLLCLGLDPVTDETWERAMALPDRSLLPLPAPAGHADSASFCLHRLDPGTTYWAGLRAFDDQGNAGPISNPVSLRTSGLAPELTDTLIHPGGRVWAWGRWVGGDTLVCRYARHRASINGIGYTVPGSHPSPDVQGASKTVIFRELVEAGVCSTEAARRYGWEFDLLVRRLQALLRNDNARAAAVLANHSPLADSVMVTSGGDLAVRFQGFGWLSLGKVGPKPRTPPDFTITPPFTECGYGLSLGGSPGRYEELVGNLRYEIASSTPERPVFLILSPFDILGVWQPDSPREFRVEIERQLEWLTTHRSVEDLPEGPLDPNLIRQILDSLEYYSP